MLEMTHKLVFLTLNIGNIHVMSGRTKFFELLVREDIYCDEMNLGMTMLASLGGTHVHDFAGAAFDDDVTVLAKSRALHGISSGGAGIGAVERMPLMLLREDE